jgi:hypothetical protein
MAASTVTTIRIRSRVVNDIHPTLSDLFKKSESLPPGLSVTPVWLFIDALAAPRRLGLGVLETRHLPA